MNLRVKLLLIAAITTNDVTKGIITKKHPDDAIMQLKDAKYFVSLGERGNCAGTIIEANFVVTAAHCVCETASTGIAAIDYANKRHQATAAYHNPERNFNCGSSGPNGNDVAVLEFEEGTFGSHDYLKVYDKSNEVGKTIKIMGMGIHGQPGDYTANQCENGNTDNELRQGQNKVLRTRNGVLSYDMSRNQGKHEAIAEDGDSGGPALIRQGSHWKVAGVNSGPADGVQNPCAWDAVDEYCRLSEHVTWIDRAVDKNALNRGLWIDYGGNDDGNQDNDDDGNPDYDDDYDYDYEGAQKI